ncbi:hypothetical protein MPSEU_000262700 [Mayamaea pseudoterrestris]|nr:hypothetical protein MPSEU_000262700 [Mayamaea pseudoterrestris]
MLAHYSQCGGVSGHLADLTTKQEFDAIVSSGIVKDRYAWIGLNDIKTEGSYQWSNGQALSTLAADQLWSQGEPSGKNAPIEDCVEIQAIKSGKWNDIKCNEEYVGILVEYDCAIPAPTATALVNGHIYQYYNYDTYGILWAEAVVASAQMTNCNEIGHLISLESAAEQNAVRSAFQAEIASDSFGSWIGLNDMRVNNNFEWVDGEKYVYKNWNGGAKPTNLVDDCVDQRKSDGIWTGRDCATIKRGFIVEFDCQPSAQPSSSPSRMPSKHPSRIPSATPRRRPSSMPSTSPSKLPSSNPTVTPPSSTRTPSAVPSLGHSLAPTRQPVIAPSAPPSLPPSAYPSALPSKQPSMAPSNLPSFHAKFAPQPSPKCSAKFKSQCFTKWGSKRTAKFAPKYPTQHSSSHTAKCHAKLASQPGPKRAAKLAPNNSTQHSSSHTAKCHAKLASQPGPKRAAKPAPKYPSQCCSSYSAQHHAKLASQPSPKRAAKPAPKYPSQCCFSYSA